MLFLFAIVELNQPASAASAGAVNSPPPQVQPRNPGDAQIERTIKSKLAKSKLAADHFTFTVVKGVVTIEGTTNVMQHKGAMTRMAKVSGATSVRNNIRVSDVARAKAAAAFAGSRKTSAISRESAPGATGPEPSGHSGSMTSVTLPRATVLPAAGSR